MIKNALLKLEDGTTFYGKSYGVDGYSTGELVFNTSMTGYQEIITDPSYASQIVVLTYPHIGNTGINFDDYESSKTQIAGLVIRNPVLFANHWKMQKLLTEFLYDNKVIAIAGVDTRKITRHLRSKGALNACIMTGSIDEERALILAQKSLKLTDLDLVNQVTSSSIYEWSKKNIDNLLPSSDDSPKPFQTAPHVVVYDYGVKQSILQCLVDKKCIVTVVPASTSANVVLSLQPDGILLSNGPGDPSKYHYAITNIKKLLLTNIPIFGICLGHQLLALSCDAKIFKMKFGHHGANHPVQDLKSQQVIISSQNHGFAVDESSLPNELAITHHSLFDGTVQGLHHRYLSAFSFQGHPEGGPGPSDGYYLFNYFITLMQKYTEYAKKN